MQPLTLDQAAAELADLGLTREMLKAFGSGGHLKLYREGAKRFVKREALATFRAWVAPKIEADPEWLGQQARRLHALRGPAREVATNANAGKPQPRVVLLSETPTIKEARVVLRGRR